MQYSLEADNTLLIIAFPIISMQSPTASTILLLFLLLLLLLLKCVISDDDVARLSISALG